MWPQTLQMTRDECRGMLRRLELESYSHVISVFRAQGGLSEPKAKLLEELRNIFHISQERHRAEARRVANDEQLCTIAEAISGPNTWQEWSREGRRAYPLLPRVNPQTALTIIANDIAAKTKAENDKLLLPAQTGIMAAEQQAYLSKVKKKGRDIPVVLEEPFKMPDIPSEAKKNLKRNNPEGDKTSNKKRNSQQYDAAVKYHHITANDMDSQQNSSKMQLDPRLVQARFFHNQYQKHKQKLSVKKVLTVNQTAAVTNKRHKATGKSGRRVQKLLQQQVQQPKSVSNQQQSRPIPAHNNHNINKNNDVQKMEVDDGLKRQNLVKLKQQQKQQPQYSPSKEKALLSMAPVQKYIVEERSTTTTTVVTPTTVSTATQVINVVTPTTVSTATQVINVTQLPATATKIRTTILPVGAKLTPKKSNIHSPVIFDRVNKAENPKLKSLQHQTANNSSSTAVIVASSLKDKPLISTTSVQKYIVEDRSSVVSPLTHSPTPPVIANPTSASVNIIKNIPVSSLNNTLITPLTPTTNTVFRKAPTNIIKTLTSIPTTGNNTRCSGIGSNNATSTTFSGSTGPQIISNIKLTPANPQTAAAAAAAAQFNLKNALCGSVKICQSANGKVYLQSANFSDATKAKLQGSFVQKLNASMLTANIGASTIPLVSTTASTTSPAGTTPASPGQQRIAIQKVQIISGPVISNAASVSGNNSVTTKPLTITGNKNNMIILPASAASNMRPITISAKGANLASIIAKANQMDMLGKTPNLVVIGPTMSTGTRDLTTTNALPNAITSISSAVTNQLITEDTPVDIINTPFIVESNSRDGAVAKSTCNTVTPETVTLLNTSNIVNVENKAIETAGINLQQQQQQQEQQQSLLVLGATDWEMELDQATNTTTPTSSNTKMHQQQQNDFNNDIIVDESFEDVIEEEEEELVLSGNDQNHTTEQITKETGEQNINNSDIGDMIEIDENTAVEYVDIDLEQHQRQQKKVKQAKITAATAADLDEYKAATLVAAQLYNTTTATLRSEETNNIALIKHNMQTIDTLAQSNITQSEQH